MAPEGMGPGLKFSVAPFGASTTSTSGETKLSAGGLNFSTGGLGTFSSSGCGEPQKTGPSGGAGLQKSVTFKLDEDAQGKDDTATGPKETREAADKGPSPDSNANEMPSRNADDGAGMKVGGFGGVPIASGVKSTSIQLGKDESGGGLKLGGVVVPTQTPSGSLKLGGELDGLGHPPKLGGVTVATTGAAGSMKHDGAAMTTPGLRCGLKLGEATPSGTLFGSANLSFSNSSIVASSGGLQLGVDLKLKPLPPMPITTATSSALTVSKETASGAPAASGLGSVGTAFGLEIIQQSNSGGTLKHCGPWAFTRQILSTWALIQSYS